MAKATLIKRSKVKNATLVTNQLNQYIQKQLDGRIHKKGSGKIKPSSLGKCYRAQFLGMIDMTPSNPIGVGTMKVFILGTLVHEYLQNLYPAIQREVEISTDDIHAFVDLVVEDQIIEIKSVGSWACKYIKQKKDETWLQWQKRVAMDKSENVMQAVYYAKALDRERARLVFVSKDNFEMWEICLLVSDYEEQLEKELEVMRGYRKSKELPPAKPRCYNGKECSYCGFKDYCKHMEGGETNGTVTVREKSEEHKPF